MDAAQWTHEQIGGLARVTMEADHHQTVIPSTNHNNNAASAGVAANTSDLRGTAAAAMLEQKRTRPSKDQNINCPRCNSTNTKFCYYNNYSLTQPRYLCKTCRRYWTQGGSLRNVPVGGGSRKNKRSSSSSTSTSTSTTSNSSIANKVHVPDLNPPNFSTASFSSLLSGDQNYSKIHHHHQLHGQDLNLSFPTTAHDFQAMFHHQALEFPSKIELGVSHHQQQQNNNISNDQNNNSNNNNNCGTASCSSSSTITSTSPLSALELLRTGMASRGGLNPYVPVPMPAGAADSTMANTLYPSSAAVAGGGFQLVQDFKPNLSFFGGDHHQGILRGSGARFGGTTSSSSIHEDHHQHENGGAAAARLLFPFADMNKMSSTSTTMDHHHQSIKGGHEDDHDQGRGGGGGSSTATATTPHHGYWNGMLGGGGTW